MASLVARGRVKFMPPKPGGKWITEKRFLDFRRATPATCKQGYKNKRVLISASVS